MTYHLRREDQADTWYHGGGDMVFLDADSRPNCIYGIGGEDYFGASWGIDTFVGPYTGCIHAADDKYSMYRFYLEGPIRFRESIRLAFGAMANEITSVAYWYQTEPRPSGTSLAPTEKRLLPLDRLGLASAMADFCQLEQKGRMVEAREHALVYAEQLGKHPQAAVFRLRAAE